MSLTVYFPSSSHRDKPEFDTLLKAIYFNPNFFSYIAHAKSGKYFHVSPSFSVLTGHSVSEIEAKGVGFYMDHVPKEDVLGVIKRQGERFSEGTKKDFNPELSDFIEMRSRLQKPDGNFTYNVAQSLVFAYLPNGEFDFALVAVYVLTPDEDRNQKIEAEIKELLSKAKQLYRRIYPQEPLNPSPAPLTEIVTETNPRHLLTQKEKQVLKKIADGMSTKEIASYLNISENTVESHRKNMLSKFNAKNVAELIKKTSKYYWLE